MAIPSAVPFINLGWDDVLFIILSVVMIGSALLVVTLRDIIRCGLAMMVSFAALAGLYVEIGAPLVAAAQVLVYIGAISVLVLFAIMLTQTKAAPARLVFQTQALPAAIAAGILALLIALTVGATNWNAVSAPMGPSRITEPGFASRARAFAIPGTIARFSSPPRSPPSPA